MKSWVACYNIMVIPLCLYKSRMKSEVTCHMVIPSCYLGSSMKKLGSLPYGYTQRYFYRGGGGTNTPP